MIQAGFQPAGFWRREGAGDCRRKRDGKENRAALRQVLSDKLESSCDLQLSFVLSWSNLLLK